MTRLIFLFLIAVLPVFADDFLSYDNTPLGTVDKPLVVRTYMPDPGLGDEVFAHHGKGANSPKYSPNKGADVPGEYKPVKGIPAAIAVNFGPALSYCFDTTECRLMYAWQGGFLDMYPYWGDPSRGNRQSFNYVPHLVGNLFYKTAGKHPIVLDGKSLSDHRGAPRFRGYHLEAGVPVFSFAVGSVPLSLRLDPADGPHSLRVTLTAPEGHTIAYRLPTGMAGNARGPSNELTVVLTGEHLANFQGYPRDTKITKASAEAGEKVYMTYGCLACHSLDGSKGHGPTFHGLYGSERKITGMDQPVTADDAYILESMKNPNAKIVDGFPPNYMPPYQLKELEYESLLLFIKSLNGQPE